MPAFLITIDTEGDDIWSNPREVTTENARYIPRFQALCEKYRLKPTWLANYEMASSEPFVEFARDAIRRGAAEVGMHLHAWNSPPIKDSGARQGMPYLIEFPEAEMGEKVKFMTDLLENRFGMKVVSHRAGRWAFNSTYAKILLERGYTVDCSVTPHVSWRQVKGYTDGPGGTDYRRFPAEPYFIDPEDISRAGASQLLEVPMTITRSPVGGAIDGVARSLPRPFRKAANRLFPAVSWFRPNGRNLGAMQRLLRERKNAAHIEFMLHSSELMPGGSPAFPTEHSIDRLYDHLDQLFAEAQADYGGLTLREFRESFD